MRRGGDRRRKQQEAIEVKGLRGSQPNESCVGGGGRRRKQQEAREVEGLRGSQPKERCGRGGQKEAAGSYRSRGPEGFPAERELWDGGKAEGNSRKLEK